MLGIHASVGGYERDTLTEKSKESSRRLARETEQWIGTLLRSNIGKQGEDRQARLVLASQPIPGPELTEVEIVRRIYRRFDRGEGYAAVARYVLALGVPGNWDAKRIQSNQRDPSQRDVHGHGVLGNAEDRVG
jgi:hypothetical protein